MMCIKGSMSTKTEEKQARHNHKEPDRQRAAKRKALVLDNTARRQEFAQRQKAGLAHAENSKMGLGMRIKLSTDGVVDNK